MLYRKAHQRVQKQQSAGADGCDECGLGADEQQSDDGDRRRKHGDEGVTGEHGLFRGNEARCADREQQSEYCGDVVAGVEVASAASHTHAVGVGVVAEGEDVGDDDAESADDAGVANDGKRLFHKLRLVLAHTADKLHVCKEHDDVVGVLHEILDIGAEAELCTGEQKDADGCAEGKSHKHER